MDQSSKETGHGYLPQVQAEDSQERQPREARIDLVSQDVPRQGGLPRKVAAISPLASAIFRGREAASLRPCRLVPLRRSACTGADGMGREYTRPRRGPSGAW